MQRTTCITIALLLAAVTTYAQGTERAAGQVASYNRVKGLVTGAANEMPEDGFAHQPDGTPRTFAQVFAHISDMHYNFCSPARGVDNPNQGSLEDLVTTKAEVLEALEASYAFCDVAFESLTEATAAEMVAGGRGGPTARGVILNRVLEHDNEMYGISTVYLRTNEEVPPASQGRGRGGRGGGRGQ